MAKIEDLIQQIPDERLRKGIAAEVKALKKTKKFGLVFEEHLPETVRLPHLPVKPGELVAVKSESGNRLWRVKTIEKKIAVCDAAVEGYPALKEMSKEFPVSDLVVVRSFGEPIYPALVPVDRIERGGPDKPWHLLINADNFHALQLLLYCYEGQVDVIYIDPPYNTGARDWKYNNDYVDANDPWRHSKWLSFLEKRLRLARRLLRPEGSALIVTIDEKEYLRLGLLLEQVFPGATIQMISTVIKPEGTGRVNEFSRTNEFIFFVSIGQVQISPSIDNMYDRDGSQGGEPVEWRDLRRRERTSVRGSRPNQFYPIFVDGVTGRIHSVGDPIPDGVRRDTIKAPRGTKAFFPLTPQGKEMVWSKHPSTFRDLVVNGYARINGATIQYLSSGTVAAIERGEVIVKGRDEQGAVIAEFPAARALMPKTIWTRDSHNPQTFGTKMLSGLLPGRNFPFPKSLYAVEDTIRFFVKAKPNAIVLDFFGGSGTTTHAVARLNRQDNGRRQSIVITNNEVSSFEAESLRNKGIYPGDPQWEAIGIFEHITCPRILASITGRTPENEPIPGDYKYTDLFPIADGFEENVEFFRLDFLDPDSVARGDAFAAILPILWMMAGCHGKREDSKGSQDWFIPKQSPFAVLIKEKEFRVFRRELAERKDIGWIFLVTDSEENFGLMRRTLGRKFQCVQLYKSYLENFRINTPEALGQGGAA